jgi:hypothetical protein
MSKQVTMAGADVGIGRYHLRPLGWCFAVAE